MPNFGQLGTISTHFLLSMLIFDPKFSKFVSLNWKLKNSYCHNDQYAPIFLIVPPLDKAIKSALWTCLLIWHDRNWLCKRQRKMHFTFQWCRNRGEQILANQLTLHQPGGANYAPHISAPPPPKKKNLQT